MKYFLISSMVLMLAVGFTACEDEPDCACVEPPTEHTYTFESGQEGWEAGFADYPIEEDEFYEVDFEVAALPSPLDSDKKGFMITGNNHSDDLFMFLARPITNLVPNTSYKLVVEVDVASNAPETSFGIGGSPGGSVYLKAGATDEEPKAIQKEGAWEMNIDKGNQSQDGADMQLLGTVGTDKDDFIYAMVSLDNREDPFIVQTNEDGELWVIVGTDSGFEGTTTLYYDQITVRLLR